MRRTRVFLEQPLAIDKEITLTKEASHHLLTVLRLKAGDPICLFNGNGGEYEGEIVATSGKQALVRLHTFNPENRESPLTTKLGIGLSRGDRFEWVLQKATELGVTEIYPLSSERTEVKLKGEREEKKLSRWRQVIVSACEQSGRNCVPTLHQTQPLSEWLNVTADIKLVLHHRSQTSLETLSELKPESAALLIGPEGGLTETEILQAQNQGFSSLTLGPRVFRTETAPLVALSLCQGLWGDFKSS